MVFNIYIKVCIGNYSFNVFAYADDVTVFCTSVSGLQRLIDKYDDYALRWRFKFSFGEKKMYGNIWKKDLSGILIIIVLKILTGLAH